jgi:hypothetical protein
VLNRSNFALIRPFPAPFRAVRVKGRIERRLFGRPCGLDGLGRIGENPDLGRPAVLAANQPRPGRFDLRAALRSAGAHRPDREGLITQIADLGVNVSCDIERHRYRDSNPGFRTENPAS